MSGRWREGMIRNVSVAAPTPMRTRAASSPFPPIADYAFLSDCSTTALIAPDGAVEWMCLPRADSASVFATLPDRSAGFFRFGPVHSRVPASRRYLPGSMVLETTWATATGWMVVTDALVMGEWDGTDRINGQRRPPGDYTARGMLVRKATCIAGQVDLMLDCMPLFDYGQTPGTWSYGGTGYGEATCKLAGQPELTLRSSLRLGYGAARATARTALSEGHSAFAALSWRTTGVSETGEADEEIATTVSAWRD